MRPIVRNRIMLVVAVALLGAAVWVVTGVQRGAVVDRQENMLEAAHLMTAMLDQETGVRGFDQTGAEEFLRPFNTGRRDFALALAAMRQRVDGQPELDEQLEHMAEVALEWQSLADGAIARIRTDGARSLTVEGARDRKDLMDQFRAESELFQDMLRDGSEAEFQVSRLVSIGVVVLLSALLLAAGLGVLEHDGRRAARRRRIEAEFIETLQSADDEEEAQELVRRHVERVLPGAAAVVLGRNASGNSLSAATPADGLPGLGERLEGATPRDCLAIRRGGSYRRSPKREPLQPCTLCGDLPGDSRCTPSLVGGEVIGSLLVTGPRKLGPTAADSLDKAVNQAAPVLANLRNLAIAEHRAATDGLTGLPNARSMREALLRLAANAGRTLRPLSAIAIDLDHFKALNDRYGHQVGDEALAAVGATLRGALRASDFAGRWGGEEFLALLPDTDTAGASEVAEKLRAALANLTIPGVPGGVTASFGVASLPDHAGSSDELLRAADRALYKAKELGRNRVERAAAADPEPVT